MLESNKNRRYSEFTYLIWYQGKKTWISISAQKQRINRSLSLFSSLQTQRFSAVFRGNKEEITRTHLYDPVSCLNTSSHRSSICNTKDRIRSELLLLEVRWDFESVCEPHLLWPAAQTQGCLRLRSARSHFHLSGLSHNAGQDLSFARTQTQ